MSDQPLLQTKKDLAGALNRSRRFASDMTRGGFRLPATQHQAIAFLRRHPHPSRYRADRASRRASCRRHIEQDDD